MPSKRKIETVARLRNLLSEYSAVIATDYRGLSVGEITELRRKLADQGTEYHVVKNTLTRLAVENTDKVGLVDFLRGPTAVTCSQGDITESAKILLNYAQFSKGILEIKGGVVDGRTLSPDDISVIATLPSREILIARVVSGIQAPIQSLVNVLDASIIGLVTVLQARTRQLEGG